jgi:hypothetical protein
VKIVQGEIPQFLAEMFLEFELNALNMLHMKTEKRVLKSLSDEMREKYSIVD